MKDTQVVYIGVDVSKETLTINAGTLFIGDILNSPEKIAATLKKIAKAAGAQALLHVCLEATGPYGSALFDECCKAGIRASILNPAKVRHYAQAISETAKTDPIDARVIKLFAETKQPLPTLPPNKTQTALRKLVLIHEALTKSKVQLSGTLESFKNDAAGKPLRQVIADLKKKIKAVDRQILEVVKEDDKLCGLVDALAEIKGVGKLTAAKTLALTPELGTLGRRQAGAISGLAPYTRDSGKFKGKTFISGGRAEIRRALFMPATVARRFNPVLKEAYEKLMKIGKPYKVAMTAIMRKLFCHMDAVAAKWLAEYNATLPAKASTTI